MIQEKEQAAEEENYERAANLRYEEITIKKTIEEANKMGKLKKQKLQ